MINLVWKINFGLLLTLFLVASVSKSILAMLAIFSLIVIFWSDVKSCSGKIIKTLD